MKKTAPPTGRGAKDTEPHPSPSPGMGVLAWWRSLGRRQRAHLLGFLGFAALLTLLFIRPLLSLLTLAAGTELHSHILLIPFISAYLIYLQRGELPTEYRTSPEWALAPLAIWVVGWRLRDSAFLSESDSLSLMAVSFVLFLLAGGFLFLGRQWMAAAAFPVGFLFFLVPLPDGAVDWLETASKLASAEVADWFFTLTRTPVLRDATVFQLPGIVIEVAQECSGIRSSWILFITSLLASQLFLKSPWRRLALVVFVIPLGILRNGFRILVIGLLCVHVGPHMIHSPIHHRGGPLFFLLSLIPLFLFLRWLRRGEAGWRRSAATVGNCEETTACPEASAGGAASSEL